jgi:hypothetical protein
VSRARSGCRRVLDPLESDAITSALPVMDFDPGRRTIAVTGLLAVGAVHWVWLMLPF